MTEDLRTPKTIPVDQWVWGKERVIWGFSPEHKYTFKILEPLQGRAGCMSLQYHHEKSETWLILRGQIWALFIVDGVVCTRVMKPGDIQNILPGMIHRLTGITNDAQVIEPSTPDRHAADKSIKKDVVRLHCYHGRPVEPARSSAEQQLLDEAHVLTEAALKAIEAGAPVPQHRSEYLIGRGSFNLPA